jgi:hypothetical protein
MRKTTATPMRAMLGKLAAAAATTVIYCYCYCFCWANHSVCDILHTFCFFYILILLFFTFRYMAPEMLNFTDRSTASDIFSFGLTFYEMCVVPNSRANLPVQGDLWLDLREGRVPAMDTEFKTRDQAMKDLLLACLEPIPQQRATAAQLLALPELLRIGAVCGAEDGDSHDSILSGIERAGAVPKPAQLARSGSFLVPPPVAGGLGSRPLSWNYAFQPVTLGQIDIGVAEGTRVRSISRERADLTTPTHVDGSRCAFMPNNWNVPQSKEE